MFYTKILFCWIVVTFIGRCHLETLCVHCCCGDLDKRNLYLFVGEILNITCTLTNDTLAQGVNSSDLYLYFNEDEEVNETTIINSTSLGMSMMMTAPFKKVLYCELKRKAPDSSTEFVDSTDVKVEYPPIAARNLNCMIYDWDQSMECTWDLGVKYMDVNMINTTLFWALPNSRNWQYCPKQELLRCTWNISDEVSFDHSPLYFKINVTNIKSNVTASTSMITIQQDDYVKPSKVDYLIAKTLNSTCATLEWRHRKIHRTKQFIISINSKWNDNKTIETNVAKCDICNLRPNTLYDFTIETVTAIGKRYRSDKVTSGTFTDIAVPDRPPEVVDGAYIADNKCDKNKRDVVVYWKSLPLEYQNGPMLGYYVSVSDFKGLLYDMSIKDPSRLYFNLALQCNQQTTIAITSWGKAGNSSASSKIFIPKHNVIAIPKHVIVEAQKNSTDTSVSVSWTPVEQNGIKSFTIFYCQYDTECTNDISWITVEPNYTSNTLDHIQFDKKYRFGVSANVGGLSSGFEWQTCHYFKSSNVRPPNVVNVKAYPENSIGVDWSDPHCGKSPYIEYYIITWCIADELSKLCQGAQSEKNIKSTEGTFYVITNLDAQATYGIRVQQVAGDGRTSEFSEMKFIKPTNSDLLAKEIAGISAGSAFLFLLAISGIIFIWRTCRRKITEIRTPYKIDTIKIKGKDAVGFFFDSRSKYVVQIPIVSQISADSGTGSMSSDTPSPEIKQGSGELYPEKEEWENDQIDRNVRYQDRCGDETENAKEIPYISRNSPQQSNRKNSEYAKTAESHADSFNTLTGGNEENVPNDSNNFLPSVGFRGTNQDKKTQYISDFGPMYSEEDEPTEKSLILPNICDHPQILSNYDDRECSQGYKVDNVFSDYITEQALQDTCVLSWSE